jgi:hypothetical protein
VVYVDRVQPSRETNRGQITPGHTYVRSSSFTDMRRFVVTDLAQYSSTAGHWWTVEKTRRPTSVAIRALRTVQK